MTNGFTNQPKILRGAFVEFGISVPPLIVVFQFNPVTISRSRSAYTYRPYTGGDQDPVQSIDFTQIVKDPGILMQFRSKNTRIVVSPETLNFDIRLDATDKLNAGDTITEQFGVAPQLSTLELMMVPKSQSVMGAALSALIGGASKAFTLVDQANNPPVILFIWGRKKVMPVNITSMSIREEEFSSDLNPTRVTVSVNLEVIEGPNVAYIYTKGLKEVMSLLNLANIGDIANTIIPM
ncbi:MAG TPA: hypothetical protein VJ464_12025 [Blastocatellia bacterium]|nr:hypothetical protein [Blastocatellia bacterium]